MYAAGIDGQESKFFPFESLVCLLIELLVDVLMNLVKEVDFKTFASSAEAGSIAGGNGKVMMRMPALDHAKGELAGGVLLDNLCETCPKNRLVTNLWGQSSHGNILLDEVHCAGRICAWLDHFDLFIRARCIM